MPATVEFGTPFNVPLYSRNDRKKTHPLILYFLDLVGVRSVPQIPKLSKKDPAFSLLRPEQLYLDFEVYSIQFSRDLMVVN